MHVRALATLLLLTTGLESSIADKETPTTDNPLVHAALKSQQSLSGDTQKTAWGRQEEEGGRNHSGTGGEAASGRLRRGREEGRTGTITLGTPNPANDVSVTFGLGSMFDAGSSLLSSLLVVTAVLGIVGIGAGVIAAVAAGWKRYDKSYIEDFSSFPSSYSSASFLPAANALPYGHHEDAYTSYRRLEEAQKKYDGE